MYLPIFVEKVFNSADQIQYITEPIYVGGYKDYIYDLQIRELSKGTIVEIIVENSDTGDYDESTEWVILGNPLSLNANGHSVGQTGQFLNWIRFIVNIKNSSGRATAKIGLTGHLTRR